MEKDKQHYLRVLWNDDKPEKLVSSNSVILLEGSTKDGGKFS